MADGSDLKTLPRYISRHVLKVDGATPTVLYVLAALLFALTPVLLWRAAHAWYASLMRAYGDAPGFTAGLEGKDVEQEQHDRHAEAKNAAAKLLPAGALSAGRQSPA